VSIEQSQLSWQASLWQTSLKEFSF